MKIAEIIPDDMPKWAQDGIDSGQFFRVCLDRVASLEYKIKCMNNKDSDLELEIKGFLRDSLEIVVDFDNPNSSSDNQSVGIRFKGEDDCFTSETIYIPEAN